MHTSLYTRWHLNSTSAFIFSFPRRAFYTSLPEMYFVNVISTRMYFAPSRYIVYINRAVGVYVYIGGIQQHYKGRFVVFRHVRRQIDARQRLDALPRVTRAVKNVPIHRRIFRLPFTCSRYFRDI
jgi:hypothetical protein